MSGQFVFVRFATAMTTVLLCATGCQLWNGRKIENRLSYQQQLAEIKMIVPEGTNRDRAAQYLKEAGVEGEFSRVGRSIFYCRIWNRKNKERWHLNIDLLFDGDGRFYATRPSDSAATLQTTETARTANSGVARRSSVNVGSSAFPSRSGAAYPSTNRSRESRPMRRGDEHRTPFGYDTQR